MIKKILSIALICLMLILSGCSENKPLVYHRVDLTDEQKTGMREFIEEQVKANNVDTYPVSGNVTVEEIYWLRHSNINVLFSEYETCIYIDESKKTENLILIEEGELFSNSTNKYVYLFLFCEAHSDYVESFDVDTVNLEDGCLYLTINGYTPRYGFDDGFTTYAIALKIKKSSLSGEIKEAFADLNVIPAE